MRYMSLTFTKKVYAIVKKIPKGTVLTYSQVATLAGSPKARRSVVGMILNRNTNPDIPCHRVIGSNGTIGGYNRGAKKKAEILKEEGVSFYARKYENI